MRDIPLVLEVSFSTFKQLLASNAAWTIYFKTVDEGDSLSLWTGVSDRVYSSWVTGADKIQYEELTNEKVEVPSRDDAIALIIGIKRILDTRLTDDNRLRVASEKSDLSKHNIITPNFADRCTWWCNSIKVEDEVAIYSSETGRWNIQHENIIDVFHGRISDEVSLETHRVSVKVNTVEKNEVDPHTLVGDFTVNYEGGYITFDPPIASDSEVKVTYHYENGSEFIIKPTPNRHLLINAVEVQFSDDVEMRDSVIFKPMGYAGVFAPELGLDPYDLVPLPGLKVYKTIYDYINESTYSYPRYKPVSPGTWRGCNHEITIVAWDYTTSTRLFSGYGMQVNVYLEHDVPMGGKYCTAAFYCTSDACS